MCPFWCHSEISREVKGGQEMIRHVIWEQNGFVLWETFVMSNIKVVTIYFSKLTISPEAFYYLTFVVVLKLELSLPYLSSFRSLKADTFPTKVMFHWFNKVPVVFKTINGAVLKHPPSAAHVVLAPDRYIANENVCNAKLRKLPWKACWDKEEAEQKAGRGREIDKTDGEKEVKEEKDIKRFKEERIYLSIYLDFAYLFLSFANN